MIPRAYRPFVSARRPGGRPDTAPRYRVLVHRRFYEAWSDIAVRVGLENAQQFWDHVALAPGSIPAVGTSTILRGRAGQPRSPGFSRTIHYEISGAGRIDYQFADHHTARPGGDEHRVVFILTIDLGSH